VCLNFTVLDDLFSPTFNYAQQHIVKTRLGKTTLGEGLLHPSGGMIYMNSSTGGLCVETIARDRYCQNFSFTFKQTLY
jgi:hypothetical protein